MQQIDKETIELQFKVLNLLNRDFQRADHVFCKIFLKNGNQDELQITQTKVSGISALCSWEMLFVPFTQLDFQFEVLQTLRVEIYERSAQNIDQLIAEVVTNVGQVISGIQFYQEIITSKKVGVLNIEHKLAIKENAQDEKQSNFMIWQGHNLLNTDFFGKSDPFLIFYKMKYEKWEKVLETYFIKDNLNPIWNVLEISDDMLYGENPQKQIKIECWDNSKTGKHNYIGEVITSQNEIENNRKEFILSNNGKTKGIGILKLARFARGRKSRFIDNLIGREKLNLIIGIDFTGSNGNPEQQQSLHYLNDQKLNQYQQTIKAFGDIVLCYTDENVEMFGFGGIPKGKDKAKFCFPLNDNEKHPLKNIKDVMQVYDNSIKQVKQSGPTYVSEILKHAKEQSKLIQKSKHYAIYQQYFILLIITDGIINDMAETRQLLLDCQQLPISIIFVGVGDEDFSEMKKIFQMPDVTRNDYRQIYQFESFKDYNDSVLLTQAVLQKIPEQYLQYKKINGRGPFNYFDN
ncbi:hypothetical protein pb186bvf_007871 [Paramecium bursaria]